ncbi:hypothetical protein J4Q44_G00154340 [Coregonus suidteri]|uniref:Uncharacterized protein n=1 Tax=Coregonus suidteri TaxID=861788 RepID=A0AAN8LX32_9TELE
MEFLRSLVPAVISGDGGVVESGGALPRETGPRLLRMKRLLAIGQTTDQDQQGLVNTSTTRPIKERYGQEMHPHCGLIRASQDGQLSISCCQGITPPTEHCEPASTWTAMVFFN